MSISLDSIVTGQHLLPPKMIVYGVGGVGKTTFAAGAPNPIFLFTEEGLGSLDVARFPLLKSWDDIMSSVNTLATQKHDYETVVLDSLDFAEPLLWQATCEAHGKDDIEAFGYGKGYTYAVDTARDLFQGLDYLRSERGMAIIIIAHSTVVRFEDPEAASYDTYDMQLQKRLAAYAHDWADAVLFANYKAHVVTDKENFNRERKRGVGSGERVLYTEKRPAFRAKNRYRLPPEIPLSWDAFESHISQPQQ